MSKIKRYKYPRTSHMPFSPGSTSDDKMLPNLDHFIGQEVVITEKMDGENTTLYPDYYLHARSIDGRHHPSRDWIKAFHQQKAYMMDPHTRICGENLYAQHSIPYSELDSYFYAFSVWSNDEEYNWCFSWDKTLEHLKYLDILVVPELWRGEFNQTILTDLVNSLDFNKQEGIVMRTVDGFLYDFFPLHTAKYVRAHHVTTDDHWMTKTIIPNKLKNDR